MESSSVKALSQHQSSQQEVIPKSISSILANHQEQLASELALSQAQNEKIVAGTYGYGVKRADDDVTFAIKRPSDTEFVSSPPKKKVQRKTSADSSAGRTSQDDVK